MKKTKEHPIKEMDMLTFWLRRADRIKRRRARKRRCTLANKGIPTYDVVCRYWLSDKCQMGEGCSFLHTYIPDKIPMCAYIDAIKCLNGGSCVFRHYYNPGERQHRVHDASRLQHQAGISIVAANPPDAHH